MADVLVRPVPRRRRTRRTRRRERRVTRDVARAPAALAKPCVRLSRGQRLVQRGVSAGDRPGRLHALERELQQVDHGARAHRRGATRLGVDGREHDALARRHRGDRATRRAAPHAGGERVYDDARLRAVEKGRRTVLAPRLRRARRPARRSGGGAGAPPAQGRQGAVVQGSVARPRSAPPAVRKAGRQPDVLRGGRAGLQSDESGATALSARRVSGLDGADLAEATGAAAGHARAARAASAGAGGSGAELAGLVAGVGSALVARASARRERHCASGLNGPRAAPPHLTPTGHRGAPRAAPPARLAGKSLRARRSTAVGRTGRMACGPRRRENRAASHHIRASATPPQAGGCLANDSGVKMKSDEFVCDLMGKFVFVPTLRGK